MSPTRRTQHKALLTSAYTSQGTSSTHSLITAPIITGDVYDTESGADAFPQSAVYGQVLFQHAAGFPNIPSDEVLYINSNAPFSALVCGVQGSGKSHSTSVILEGCLIQDPRIGTLPAPLSGLVFHLDFAAGGGAVQPCEAAYLGSLDSQQGGLAGVPSVTVLVLPTSLVSMKKVYAGIPSVRVEPLHFADQDINSSRLLAIMKVDESGKMPLYMEAVMNLLRSMDAEDSFCYESFKRELKGQGFDRTQLTMLNIRLSLLDSCLRGGNTSNRVATHFREGALTIIDLSSPFMDSCSACGFFDLILGLFMECRSIRTGKLVVLDEAHKYLTENTSSSRLTESLLGIVRQQRHLNMRVVISTQEPTVVPAQFLDLCSIIIAHRFTSVQWMKHLVQHMSTAEDTTSDMFRKIVGLSTGQALLFSPAGMSLDLHGEVAPLGAGYLCVQSRLRITSDGGHSILAVANANFLTRVETHVDSPSFTSISTPMSNESDSNSSLATSVSVLRSHRTAGVLPTITVESSNAGTTTSASERNPEENAAKEVTPKVVHSAADGSISMSTYITKTGTVVPDRFLPLVESIVKGGALAGYPPRYTAYFSAVQQRLPMYNSTGASFMQHLEEAETSGIVSLHKSDYFSFARLLAEEKVVNMTAATKLNPAPSTSSAAATQDMLVAANLIQVADTLPTNARFQPLIDILTRCGEEKQTTWEKLCQFLLSYEPKPQYDKVKTYFSEAKEAGVITLNKGAGDEVNKTMIQLCV